MNYKTKPISGTIIGGDFDRPPNEIPDNNSRIGIILPKPRYIGSNPRPQYIGEPNPRPPYIGEPNPTHEPFDLQSFETVHIPPIARFDPIFPPVFSSDFFPCKCHKCQRN
jgi:hypothetical protein